MDHFEQIEVVVGFYPSMYSLFVGLRVKFLQQWSKTTCRIILCTDFTVLSLKLNGGELWKFRLWRKLDWQEVSISLGAFRRKYILRAGSPCCKGTLVAFFLFPKITWYFLVIWHDVAKSTYYSPDIVLFHNYHVCIDTFRK